MFQVSPTAKSRQKSLLRGRGPEVRVAGLVCLHGCGAGCGYGTGGTRWSRSAWGAPKRNGTPRCFGVPAPERWVRLRREGARDGAVVQAPFMSAVGSRSGSAGLVFLGEGAQSERGLVGRRSRAALLPRGCAGAGTAARLLSTLREGFHPKRPCEQRLDKAARRYSETSASLNSAAPRGVPGMLPGSSRGVVIPSSPYPTR